MSIGVFVKGFQRRSKCIKLDFTQIQKSKGTTFGSGASYISGFQDIYCDYSTQ